VRRRRLRRRGTEQVRERIVHSDHLRRSGHRLRSRRQRLRSAPRLRSVPAGSDLRRRRSIRQVRGTELHAALVSVRERELRVRRERMRRSHRLRCLPARPDLRRRHSEPVQHERRSELSYLRCACKSLSWATPFCPGPGRLAASPRNDEARISASRPALGLPLFFFLGRSVLFFEGFAFE
jgi:hypothetical protein